MVLTEIPLWVTHGSNADTSSKSAMGIASNSGGVPQATITTDEPSSSSSTKDKDLAAAKSAVSLLQSTRGGVHRAPMYSVDVHPDGTRFATAAGDGTVKIWSMGSLFGGKLGQNNNSNYNRTTTEKKRRGATSRFLDNGNYVSSNSEGYDTSSSLTSSAVASGKKEQQQSNSSVSSAAAAAAKSAANDLSGLVRKKKGGATSTSTATAAAAATNPFANNAPQSYSDSPLSRLTQRNSTTSSNSTKDAQQQQELHKQHKLLTTISSHQGSVLALRFSTSGKYLATAGDDSYVNIYVRSNAPSLAKGNLVGVGADGGKQQVEEDVEHWNRIALCRGHQLDVVGLAWAPDDSHLVSCSLDSVHPVIVWRLFDVLNDDNTTKGDVTSTTATNNNISLTSGSVYMHNLHPFKVLGKNVHKSTVKGVAFDPAGKFIASSGDDPAICIWRASDDWGLEARIDASSGVFKSKKRKKGGGGGGASGDNDEEEEDDPGELASLSMFRRISFAPDGSHVCGTNATLKGKNIAAMISREGWAASGPNPKSSSSSQGGGGDDDESHHHPPGAANLVGHKQPVVSSRHCPVFFQAPSSKRKRPPSAEEASSGDSDSEDDDGGYEPEYATLVALGDKRGFVTVWSTKSSRPIFKMQCSESRCAVTDISWGLVRSSKGDGKDSLIMIVSLLDGFVVALHFSIPAEVGGGRLLSAEKTKRIFRMKYGIDDGGKRLVDDSGPALIENALQFTMEMEANDTDGDNMSDSSKASVQRDQRNVSLNATNGSIRDTQVISTKKGKKRIAPVLLTANGSVAINVTDEDGRNRNKKSKTANDQSSDPLQNALNAAEIAASAAEGVAASNATNVNNGASGASQKQDQHPNVVSTVTEGKFSQGEVRIPYNQNRVLTTELVATNKSSTSGMFETEERSAKIVADCVNSAPVSTGVSSWPFTTLSISRGGVRGWKDIIAKSTCTTLVANERILVVGTANGCIYLYGTSPTLGWESGKAFRAFPPYVLGSPVVAINLSPASSDDCEMVAVTSDGGFFVYKILESGPKLVYKGSIVPPMQHMLLSSTSANQRGVKQPKLVRIQITESKRLMLVLMLPTATVGRALQGFVYNRDMESWMLVSDSNNFLLSDFYSPIHKVNIGKEGILSRIDKIVTSSASTMASAKQMYQRVVENEKHSYQHIITRSHCEDRLACSIALESRSEFESWLALYARCLSSSGEAEVLRFLVDALLNDSEGNGDFMVDGSGQNAPSFLSVGINRLGLDGKHIIRQTVLPEMSKNRHMQRLTNEVSIELDNL